jgi:translation initiation factor IF-3
MNEGILAPSVFVIGDNGEQIGDTPLRQAIAMAREAEMDLVEVNPLGNPPVAKIMDYGQFKYEREKKAHKQKVAQKKTETKGIRLSVRISEHDLCLRVDQAKKFLEKGNKLNLEVILKGRERQHPEKAVETMNEFVAELNKDPELKILKEQDLTRQGGRFTMVLVNKTD